MRKITKQSVKPMIRLVAKQAAKTIGLKERFQLRWFSAVHLKALSLLSDMKMGTILCGCNEYDLTGKRVIYLNFDQLKKDLKRKPMEAVNTVCHEVCHFRAIGHGRDFMKLYNKTMKFYDEYNDNNAKIINSVLKLTKI